ncbi:MAG: hypothetical protein HEP71_30690 [Roseivirga sp.]|nr:hypothetical protein [Roseivirga sp.]
MKERQYVPQRQEDNTVDYRKAGKKGASAKPPVLKIQQGSGTKQQGHSKINTDPQLEKEADKMGSQVKDLTVQESGSDKQTALIKTAELSNSTAPVQPVMNGDPPYEIHLPAILSPEAEARLHNVLGTLTTSLDNDPALHIQRLIISIEQEGFLDKDGNPSTIEGDNPAQTDTTFIFGDGLPSIKITMQRAFVEASSEGEILGMLAHEVGVHNIPSDFLGIDDLSEDTFDPVFTDRKQAKDNTDSGGYEFDDWANHREKRDGKRQHDHVMVADILRNLPEEGGPIPLTRANVYFQTVLNIGDTLWANEDISSPQRRTQAKELIHLYLVDIARIIGTDDGRMSPLKHTGAIFDLYREVFNLVILPRKGSHPWIPAELPKSSRFSLGTSLAQFVGKVKLEKLKDGPDKVAQEEEPGDPYAVQGLHPGMSQQDSDALWNEAL